MEIDISRIVITGRQRKNLGDIPALAESIRTLGLLQPVAVTPDFRLVAGERRLAALRLLGMTRATVSIVTGLDDAVALLTAERDENACRKPFTLSEAVAVRNALAALEAPRARERQRAGLKRGAEPPRAEKFAARDKGRALDKAGEAVGYSRTTCNRAAEVVAEAEKDPATFAPLVEEMDRRGKVNGVYARMKELKARKEREKIDGPITEGLRVGDFREVLENLGDGSVNLIFTDPPYDKESMSLYGDLAKLAGRVLAPGGSLVCYAGQYALLELGPLMTPHLRYQWTFCVRHSGGQRRMHGWRVRVGWKPLLWFVQGRYTGEYLLDLLDSEPGDKAKHEWAQGRGEAKYLIERLCPPGGLVLDPMAGSGTTLRVAKTLGRRFLGVEIDSSRAKVASAGLLAS